MGNAATFMRMSSASKVSGLQRVDGMDSIADFSTA
jgi:hypothetical protein